MADYYASIYGTEKDKVNCSFYFKIGACRHGDRCSRVHNKPTFSQTILLQNLYVNPTNQARSEGREMTEEEDQRHFDEFFEDIFVELEHKYGPIEEMNVCDNLGDHLIGNVYVKFKDEANAESAAEALNERWFGGKPVYAELSTISDDLRGYLFGTGRGTNRSRHRSHRSSKTRDSRSRSPSSISPSRSSSRSRSSSLVRHKSPSYGRRKSPSSRHRGDRNSSRRRHRNRRSARRARSPPRHRSHSNNDYNDDDVEGPELPPPRESYSRSHTPGARSPRSRSVSPATRRRGAERAILDRESRSRSRSPANGNSELVSNNNNHH